MNLRKRKVKKRSTKNMREVDKEAGIEYLSI
jgi:hypothetical protein